MSRPDPYLAHRLAAATRLRRNESAVYLGVIAAMRIWLDTSRALVLGRPIPQAALDLLADIPPVTAAATGGPDIDAMRGAMEVWARAIGEHVDPALNDAFGEAFLDAMRRSDISPLPWQLAYLEQVHDRLKIWPADAFEELRPELLEMLSEQMSIDEIEERIARTLDIDAPTRRIRGEIDDIDRRLQDPTLSRAEKAELRARKRELWTQHDASQMEWRWKARRIARTEIHGATEGGAYAAALAVEEAGGEARYKRWLGSHDERIRGSHAIADGQICLLREPFTVGRAELLHPGQAGGPGHEVINCRCSCLYMTRSEVDAELARNGGRGVAAGGARMGPDDPDEVDAELERWKAMRRGEPLPDDAGEDEPDEDTPPEDEQPDDDAADDEQPDQDEDTDDEPDPDEDEPADDEPEDDDAIDIIDDGEDFDDADEDEDDLPDDEPDDLPDDEDEPDDDELDNELDDEQPDDDDEHDDEIPDDDPEPDTDPEPDDDPEDPGDDDTHDDIDDFFAELDDYEDENDQADDEPEFEPDDSPILDDEIRAMIDELRWSLPQDMDEWKALTAGALIRPEETFLERHIWEEEQLAEKLERELAEMAGDPRIAAFAEADDATQWDELMRREAKEKEAEAKLAKARSPKSIERWSRELDARRESRELLRKYMDQQVELSNQRQAAKSLRDDPPTTPTWKSIVPELRQRMYIEDSDGNLLPPTQLARHLDDVLAVGEVVRSRIYARFDSDPKLTHLRAKLDVIKSKPAVGGYTDTTGLDEVQRDIARRESEIVRAALNEAREFGGFEQRVAQQTGPGQGKSGPAQQRTVDELRNAENFFPARWLRTADQRGTLQLATSDRAFFGASMGEQYRDLLAGPTSSDAGLPTYRGAFENYSREVVVHEMGHRMEKAIPGLTHLEYAFVRKRATRPNGDLEHLKTIYPGTQERGLFDKWLNPYAGKVYSPKTDADPARRAHEVFQVGLQDVFGRSAPHMFGDEELQAFVMGVMLAL